jgi:hypothetical protein
MDWIDQNLDAYRVIAEILTDLRPLVRERIESKHGKEWFRIGIPEEVFERLIRNKEREASIDWYENRYQEVISYATFPDLFEIISANPGLFDPILKLAPSHSLLNTRFLELEVMRSKIGRARQVSEAEINFLTSFHLRFRRAVQELKEHPSEVSTLATEPVSAAEHVAAGGQEKTVSTPAETTDESTTTEESPDRDIDDEETELVEQTGAPERPPQRLASPTADTQTDEEVEVDDVVEEANEVEESTDDDKDDKPNNRETPSIIVKRAMENNDDPAVLREVYREVTGIAEVIWTTDEIPTTRIWDRVSTNVWYEASFSSLELRPLSDFYELISQVRTKRKDGASKTEIQSFLNDSRFATTLLALRDMFQKNKI